jgi:hypothetical protein
MYGVLYMPSLRTQIYLTREQRRKLDERRRRDKRSLAQVIRDAIDAYLGAPAADAQKILDDTVGSIPDFEIPPRKQAWANRERKLGTRG